jgi:hypothetical protein
MLESLYAVARVPPAAEGRPHETLVRPGKTAYPLSMPKSRGVVSTPDGVKISADERRGLLGQPLGTVIRRYLFGSTTAHLERRGL